jgi:hypothetical protein
MFVTNETTSLVGGKRRSVSERRPWSLGLACLMGTAVAVVVALGVVMARSSSRAVSQHTAPSARHNNNKHSSEEEVNSATISFYDLAVRMVPASYEAAVALASTTLTGTVLPEAVAPCRKALLEARNLVDVFSPLYPNTTTGSSSDGSSRSSRSTDLWNGIRHYLDVGYTLVGEYQDLHNSGASYSKELLLKRRTVVLDWKQTFDKFNADVDCVAFLQSPCCANSNEFRHHTTPTTTYHHTLESRLFWKNVKLRHRPCGVDSATTSLHWLAANQLKTVLHYLHVSTDSLASVLNGQFHEDYHSLRKELRSLENEFDLFGTVMLPSTTNETNTATSVVDLFTSARLQLGSMNDDFTAYSIYLDSHTYPEEQARLTANIEVTWDAFKQWLVDSNFTGAMQDLARMMNSTLSPGIR